MAETQMSEEERANLYWRANVRLLATLMSIWGIVGLILPFALIKYVNQIPFFGMPFGFWLAQQGSIFVFLALIFIYVWRMNRLEHKLGLWDE
jgi:putative solute:sodium symporter small subunit